MKFFTREWHGGDMTDDEAQAVCAAYQVHVSAIAPLLPPDAVRLARNVSLHDGLLRYVHFAGGRLEVVLRAGDLQVGYFDARIVYSGTSIKESDLRFLRESVGSREVELLYDEFDSAGAEWVHRALFWPYREVSVGFSGFELSTAPAASRFDGAA